MAVEIIEPQSKNIFPIILIIISLIAGPIFYFQIIKPSQEENQLPSNIQEEIKKLQDFEKLELNFSIFNNPEFKKLKMFTELPVKPVSGGKPNLFAP